MRDILLLLWALLLFPSMVVPLYDFCIYAPQMPVMKPAWILMTLYTGPLGLSAYLLTCQRYAPATHSGGMVAQWKQAVGATVLSGAGAASGIILAAIGGSLLSLPLLVRLLLEYGAGLGGSLLLFQPLFLRDLQDVPYLQALWHNWLPEGASTSALAAGMLPTLLLSMPDETGLISPLSPHFWGGLSMGVVVGAGLAYPVNWWLVAHRLKPGTGSEQALGWGGHPVIVEAAQGWRKAAGKSRARSVPAAQARRHGAGERGAGQERRP